MVGKTLGHYEILEPLGAGGMGEVYRALDTKLERDVAIKVLPEDLADDSDRLARLEREAKLLAALNHPNIATVHALEGERGTVFLVLELVKGESLEHKLVRGPLPVDEALDLCRQIAEALEAAHGAGIVHRDLKPANLLITPDGRAKVLDFGIAKSVHVDANVAATANATNLTVAGSLVGTPSYMSPEQVRGEEIDKRADIWAFGCALFETLSGRSAFARETLADTLAAVVDHEPDWSALPGHLPPRVNGLIERCLRKDPGRRLHDIADARIEIEDALASDGGSVSRESRGSVAPSTRTAAALVLATVVGLVAGWLIHDAGGSRAVDPVALTISLPGDLVVPTFSFVGQSSRATLAISPAGDRVAFTAVRDGVGRLFLRNLNNYVLIEVPRSEQAQMPFFSPDGRHVGFIARGKLWRAALPDGVPVEIADVTPVALGASWGPDNTIVYAPSYASGLWRVAADGGTPEPLTTLDLDAGEASHRWPQVLPDGSGVLFTIKPNTAQTLNDGMTAVAALPDGAHRVVFEGGSTARYVEGGFLMYPREGRLFAATFDLDSLQVGAPAGVLDGVVNNPINGSAWVDVSNTGTMAWVAGGEVAASVDLAWLDADGERTPLMTYPPGNIGQFSIAPDGRRAVVEVAAANDKLWILELGEEPVMSRLSRGAGNDTGAAWSPDGQWVIFSSDRAGGEYRLYRLPVAGGSAAEPLGEGEGFAGEVSVSARAGLLAFAQARPGDSSDILVAPIAPDGSLAGEPTAAFESPFTELDPALSVDGTLLAFASDESGTSEVYVGAYPGTGAKRQVSLGGGYFPRWEPRGDSLLYWNGEGIHSVEVTLSPELVIGGRRLILELGHHIGGAYDVTPDGRRILVGASDHTPWLKTEINVVLNWLELLKVRVPAGR